MAFSIRLFVRNVNYTDIRLNRTERIVCRFCTCLSYCIK